MPTQRARPRPPDFLIIGAQRGGTASLFDALMTHPLMAPPSRREVHYFDLRYWRSDRWYRRQFARDADRCSGESSPYYLYHPLVPSRVAADLPGVRVIALVRDPIERAWSQHQLNTRRGQEDLGFLDALAAESARLAGQTPPGWPRRRLAHRDHSYAARGDYRPQLDRWRAAAGPDALLVLRSADLFRHPEETHARVLDHIGVPAERLSTPHRHRSPEPLDDDLREAAARYFVDDQVGLRHHYGVDYG